MNISIEQQMILEELEKERNVLVNAVPGSGKTTTILHIAKNTSKKIVCVTFSKRLQSESEMKVQGLNCRIKFYTVHSIIFRCYGKNEAELTIEDYPNTSLYCDIFIIDEAQDLGYKLFILLKKIIRDSFSLLVVLGDSKQCIFDRYQKVLSDSRFLTMADKIHDTNYPWSFMPLTESFRLTRENAAFMNRVVLNTNGQFIRSSKNGVKPRYVICNSTNRNTTIINEIQYYLSLGYKQDDIFILCPTVLKYEGNLQLMNSLSNKGYCIYTVDKGDKFLEEASRNKLNFITFHSSKGLERKVIIVTTFDDSYYGVFDSDSRNTCPNIMYVGLTRAKERLSVIRNSTFKKLPFTDESNLSEYADIINVHNIVRSEGTNYVRKKARDITVTELLEHNNTKTIAELLKTISIEQIAPRLEKIHIPETMFNEKRNIYEQVSNISGVGIISYYEYLKTGKMTIKPDITPENFTIENVLRYAIKDMVKNDGLLFRDVQINKTDWITQEQMNRCMERLNFIEGNGKFEEPHNRKVRVDDEEYRLLARADYLDYENGTILEFKCKNELDPENFLQVLLYCYIFESNYDAYVFNVLTNEHYRIHYDYQKLHNIVVTLITRMNENNRIDNEEFLEKCNLIF